MRIGKWGGIDVYIHWTFWLLIAYYLLSVTLQRGPVEGLLAVGFVLAVFVCVALHEFGHAGAAAYFGIHTLDITLLPIGGVARLKNLPEKPYQELIVALAGPAVNFVIASLLISLVIFGQLSLTSTPNSAEEISFLDQLLAANLILAIFNLLPAFPMDGGRVLRSLLAMRLEHLRATEIAARVGRWMSLLFLLLGLIYFQLGLILLALFIFVAGTAELFAARFRALGPGVQAGGYTHDGSFGTWQVRSWPSQTGPSMHAEWPDHRDIIDATEVRELPNSQPARPERLN